ncbi:dihydrofolate reductase family protein, partial [Streptomyces clavuligerus]|uniref:dihydrofolate reductase family protein n=1 Tax=Streptomyces clavuligerus TaxID=1901 RepID=UPI0018D04BA4
GGLVELSIVLEELGAAGCPLLMMVVSPAICGTVIARYGTAEQGLRRLLTEGGPRLLGHFMAAGVLDELCLTLSPTVTAGDSQRIAHGPAMAVPARFTLAGVLEEDGFLFTRYQRV